MTDKTKPDEASGTQVPQERRIAFERLRERTDELELIISGLTVFALFALPGFLLDLWTQQQPHVEGELSEVLQIAVMFACGLSYTLAITFVIHLAIRAYWVGLIGLKATFPGGIRWESARMLGPVARSLFKRRLPDIDTAIDRADRLASIAFALASLVAILTVWVGLLIAALIAIGTLLSSFTGWSNRIIQNVLVGAFMLFTLLSLLNWLVDAKWVERHPELAERAGFRRWLERSIWVSNMLMPQRLILPVQLTLQSNLPWRHFSVFFMVAVVLVPIIGTAATLARANFAPINSYRYFGDDAAESAMRSAYYESMRGSDDGMLRLPMIPSDRIADSYLRLFLPYLPARDNALLRERCDNAATLDTATRTACLASPWQVFLDGKEQSVADFMVAERRDIGMRGLQGYLPLAGFSPGRHDLHVVWNGQGSDEGSQRRRDYRIPFWFAPVYELAVE